MPFEKELDELEKKRARALEMGGSEKVKKQHDKGKLTARERIDRLLDAGSFLEVGMFNHSDVPGMEEKTPADSKIAGYGKVDGRQVAVVSNDFTVLAATSSRVAGRKEGELKVLAAHRGHPVIYLGEAGGARMPDIMGSGGLASYGGGGFGSYLEIMSRVRQTPMITAILGECYGMPTWMACLSDFVVQVKGSAMGVSGPRVVELALGESVTDEELGGWRVHAEITANVVYGGKPSAADKGSEEWQKLMHRLVDDASPYGAAAKHYIHDVIDPKVTRSYIIRALEISHNTRRKGISAHKLANWPTKF